MKGKVMSNLNAKAVSLGLVSRVTPRSIARK
jgi:hypothetical protein